MKFAACVVRPVRCTRKILWVSEAQSFSEIKSYGAGVRAGRCLPTHPACATLRCNDGKNLFESKIESQSLRVLLRDDASPPGIESGHISPPG